MSKRPSFKLVRYETGRRGNNVLWRGDVPITRVEAEEQFGSGRYVLFMYGPGIRGMKPYDRFCVGGDGGTQVFNAETWDDDEPQEAPKTASKGSSFSALSDSQLFEALDRLLEADIQPDQLPRAKAQMKAVVGELKSRGTSKEQWETFAADKGGDKLLYMLGGVVAGGALGAIAMAYYYNGKLKAIEAEMESMKAQLYQTQQVMRAPSNNPDWYILHNFNQQHGGSP